MELTARLAVNEMQTQDTECAHAGDARLLRVPWSGDCEVAVPAEMTLEQHNAAIVKMRDAIVEANKRLQAGLVERNMLRRQVWGVAEVLHCP